MDCYFSGSLNDPSDFLFEGGLGPQVSLPLQDGTFLSSGSEQPEKDIPEDLDLSFLPDELSTQEETQESAAGFPQTEQPPDDSGVCLSSPLEPSAEGAGAAECQGGAQVPGITSPFCPPPMTPMTPITPKTLLMESSKIVPQLQNIVSTVNLGCRLDLKSIALQARNAEYNPQRFAAVIMRIREPRTTALIFSSGKMVCTGAVSEDESKLAARKYARVVQKLGYPARFMDFTIQNMVGSCDVMFPIRLEGLVLTHNQFCSYEPELFPGLIYRMVQPRMALLIFVSGKVVLTGAKQRSEIYEAFEQIYPILRTFRKQ